MFDSPENKVWRGMRKRCNSPQDPAYPRYGGRGIKVCERWSSFENFLEDMGPRPPGTGIERIDNDKGYEPGNCKWATMAEQNKNKSNIWKPNQIETMRDMLARGHSFADVGRVLGKSSQAVSSRASRLGVRSTCKPFGSLIF
jgi:hypothetical protein